MVEGGDALVDVTQVDAAGSGPEAASGIVMILLEPVVQVHLEVISKR